MPRRRLWRATSGEQGQAGRGGSPSRWDHTVPRGRCLGRVPYTFHFREREKVSADVGIRGTIALLTLDVGAGEGGRSQLPGGSLFQCRLLILARLGHRDAYPTCEVVEVQLCYNVAKLMYLCKER